jgi:hypothetical protein
MHMAARGTIARCTARRLTTAPRAALHPVVPRAVNHGRPLVAPALASVPISFGESSGQLWQGLIECATQSLLPAGAQVKRDAADDMGRSMVVNLEARETENRLAALAALAELEHWDTTVVPALIACAQADASSRVRQVACSMLAEEALRGNSDAACAVARMSRDSHPQVRMTAVSALTCLAEFGLCHIDKVAAKVLGQMDVGFRWNAQF